MTAAPSAASALTTMALRKSGATRMTLRRPLLTYLAGPLGQGGAFADTPATATTMRLRKKLPPTAMTLRTAPPVLPPDHGFSLEFGQGVQTVHYLGRDGVEKSATLPNDHPILENFHRGIELYWRDLEGAAEEFAKKIKAAF
jgi:hypothetical protein